MAVAGQNTKLFQNRETVGFPDDVVFGPVVRDRGRRNRLGCLLAGSEQLTAFGETQRKRFRRGQRIQLPEIRAEF